MTPQSSPMFPSSSSGPRAADCATGQQRLKGGAAALHAAAAAFRISRKRWSKVDKALALTNLTILCHPPAIATDIGRHNSGASISQAAPDMTNASKTPRKEPSKFDHTMRIPQRVSSRMRARAHEGVTSNLRKPLATRMTSRVSHATSSLEFKSFALAEGVSLKIQLARSVAPSKSTASNEMLKLLVTWRCRHASRASCAEGHRDLRALLLGDVRAHDRDVHLHRPDGADYRLSGKPPPMPHSAKSRALRNNRSIQKV